ncbi:hypothetical protein FQZ97_1145140 [compost metagenome]
MRIVVFHVRNLLLPLLDKLGVIEITQIRRYAIVITPVFGAGHLLAAEQRFIQLLAMPSTDHLNGMLRFIEQLGQCLGQGFYRGGRSLLHEQVTIVAMLKGVQHQIYSVG